MKQVQHEIQNIPIISAYEQLTVLCFVYKSFTNNITWIQILKTKITLKNSIWTLQNWLLFSLPKLRLKFKYANKFTLTKIQ